MPMIRLAQLGINRHHLSLSFLRLSSSCPEPSLVLSVELSPVYEIRVSRRLRWLKFVSGVLTIKVCTYHPFLAVLTDGMQSNQQSRYTIIKFFQPYIQRKEHRSSHHEQPAVQRHVGQHDGPQPAVHSPQQNALPPE